MSSEIDFSDSTILLGQFAQNLLLTERTLSRIQSEPNSEPASLPEIATVRDHADPDILLRRSLIDSRHQTLATLLNQHQLHGIILSRPEFLSWFTSGANLNPVMQLWRHPIFAFITPTHRMILCDATQSARLFEEELFGLGFLLKEFPLIDGPQAMLSNLITGKKIAWDLKLDDHRPLQHALVTHSRELAPTEHSALRKLGRRLALCVETTAATLKQGETERDVAAQLVHRIMREGIAPINIQILADDRPRHFRSASPSNNTIANWAVVSATGRKDGLEASLSRCISFGNPRPEIIREFEVASMAQTTGVFFTRPLMPLTEIAPKVRRILEKNGFADEWGRDSQLVGAGRPTLELLSTTNSLASLPIPSQSAWAWQVSVGSSRTADTIIIDNDSYECVTLARHSSWPLMEISVKGQSIKRPSYLKR